MQNRISNIHLRVFPIEKKNGKIARGHDAFIIYRHINEKL